MRRASSGLIESSLFKSKDKTKYIKLRMTIADSGVGISKENLSKLFTDYGRL